MWNDVNENRFRPKLMRGLLSALGFAGILWPSLALPTFRLEGPARGLSAQILNHDRFGAGALKDALTQIESELPLLYVAPDILRAGALAARRVSEEALGGSDPGEQDHQLEAVSARVRSALLLNPADSFLWLELYSDDIARNGFSLSSASYLNQSYITGPREGWIALRRNRLALAAFPLIGETLQERIVLEFSGLVDGNFLQQAIINLTTVGWNERYRLLASVERVDIQSRETFARRLMQDGVKLNVPGVEIDERPWR